MDAREPNLSIYLHLLPTTPSPNLVPPNQGVGSGDVFGVPPSIVHEYPNDAGCPNVIISSGVATREYLKPVSSNLPTSVCGAFAAAEAKREDGLSMAKGDTMLSFLI